MIKVNKNSNKARSRKRKTKARVQDLRNRNKKLISISPWYFTATEAEKLEVREKVESFSEAQGVSFGMPKEEIERTKVLLRFDMLFNTHKLLEVV